ncbi:hypothetical protein VTL71DRAFT_14788 [Oculimacula yallundae]|uniref:Rhodopsin domain-containing protein n=1 Tax=Oculimacula yallundae TaxID=86028 RepID=A0ABR4CJM0_9HELO
MGDFDPAFVHSLAVQSWTLYGIGILLIIVRTYSRIHRVGARGLQLDDYLMLLAGGFYTALVVCLNVISGGGGSNLYPPGSFETFTPQNIQDRIKGSKIVIISEQAMLNVIYTIKACMLIMFTRLTLGLQVQRMVVYLAIYVAIGWVATEIAFFTACTPFSGYWAMPPPNPQCTTLEHYAIIQACFNISSDVLMLCIPLPLITKLNIPLKQKSVLLVIFSMGIFVVLAAVLTKVFNLSNIWDPSYMLWYTREASVAIYVSNLPMIWPLLREWFPSLKALTPGQRSSSKNLGYGPGGGRPRTTTIAGRHLSGGFGGKRLSDGGIVTTILAKGESTEELSTGNEDTELGIVRGKDEWEKTPTRRGDDESWDRNEHLGDHGGIHMTTTVVVSVTEENKHVGEQRVMNPGPLVMGRSTDLEEVPRPSYDWDYEHNKSRR